jgi:4-amino-4-deoxy-L-arabinose transferase-like glycosyltransferase
MRKWLNSIKNDKIMDTLLLSLTAFMLRFWNYTRFPLYRTDELEENLLALENKYFLTSPEVYIGPTYSLIMRNLLLFCGVDYRVPRLFVILIGVLTVVVLYAYGYNLFGRFGGLLAGGMLALAPAHIYVGRMAWSASLTPLFMILSLYFFNVANQTKRWKLLAFAFLTLGLAVQSHPIAMAFCPGIAVYFLFSKDWLKRKTFWLSLLAFPVGYLHMIYASIVLQSDLFSLATQHLPRADLEGFIGSFLYRFYRIFCNSFKMVMGNLERYYPIDSPWFYLLVFSFLLGLSVLEGQRRYTDKLLSVPIISFFIIAPLGAKPMKPFPEVYSSHYVLPVIPLIMLVITSFFAFILPKIVINRKSFGKTLLILCFMGLLIFTPVLSLPRLYADNIHDKNDGMVLNEVVDYVKDFSRSSQVLVILDRGVPHYKLLYLLLSFESISTVKWGANKQEFLVILDSNKNSTILYITSPLDFAETSIYIFQNIYPHLLPTKIVNDSDGIANYLIYKLPTRA